MTLYKIRLHGGEAYLGWIFPRFFAPNWELDKLYLKLPHNRLLPIPFCNIRSQTPARILRYHIHKDVFPDTDHGYTWIESYWFTVEDCVVSPFCPANGCTARLGHMPGGPIASRLQHDIQYYQSIYGLTCKRGRITEKIHTGYHRVGQVSITKAT